MAAQTVTTPHTTETFTDSADDLWNAAEMSAIRRSPVCRKIVEIMWLDDLDIREAVRVSMPLETPKAIGARLWYCNRHSVEIKRAVNFLKTKVFTDPLSLVRLTERAAEVGLRCAENVQIVLEQGYEERANPETGEITQIAIGRDRRAQLRLALEASKLLIAAHSEKEKTQAVRDITAYNAPNLQHLLRKVAVLAPELARDIKEQQNLEGIDGVIDIDPKSGEVLNPKLETEITGSPEPVPTDTSTTEFAGLNGIGKPAPDAVPIPSAAQ